MRRRGILLHCVKLCYNICVLFIIVLIILYIKRCQYNAALFSNISECGRKYILFNGNKHKQWDTTTLKRFFKNNNHAEIILNEDVYGPIQRDSVIIVVNVNQDINSLKMLLASLCEVKGIEDALIIFSHKNYDANVNKLVQKIDFCRVLQLFYPYSLQAYAREFPGFSINDCPKNIGIHKAKYLNCNEANYPDIHGKYRDPVSAESKHHWWWTANMIFDRLSSTKHHNGLFVFVQQSSFFTEDFLYMVLNMKKVAETLPQCDFLSLGTCSTSSLHENNSYRLDFTTWDPRYHTKILVFDVSVWKSIVAHYNLFCLVDDSSWERSLLYISLNRRDGKRFKVLSSVQPRGLDLSKNVWIFNYEFNDFLETLNLQKMMKNWLFPPFLEVHTDIELEDDEYMIFDIMEGKGGWSDPRDIQLCTNTTVSKVRKLLLDVQRGLSN